MKRYVEEREVLKRVPHGTPRKKVERFLRRQPTVPDLVSRKAAAEILGVASPHISRFEDQGRMPEPIIVEGAGRAYVREEVEAFRDVLEEQRRARAQRKEEVE